VRAVVLRAFVTSVTLASSSMSSSPARAEDAPAPEHDEAAWAYPKRGLSFFPDGPGRGNDRVSLGGIWQIAPMVTASYMRGLGSGFSFDTRFKTIVVFNQLGLGTQWATHVGPFSLGLMGHVDGFFGTLGKALIASTSFDAVGWGVLVEPGAKAGIQVSSDSWLTLQLETYLSVFQGTKLGNTVLRPDSATYAGFGVTLVVEYSPKKTGAFFYGASFYDTAANYPIWFNVEASGSTDTFSARKISYLGLVAGYEL
jgi:hypothetical protein